MRRSPFSQSSTSALLFSPLMRTVSLPSHEASICQSSAAMRIILKVTRALAMEGLCGILGGNAKKRGRRVHAAAEEDCARGGVWATTNGERARTGIRAYLI